MERKIETKKIYRHFKGDHYLVEDLAVHSETREVFVVYRALYGEQKLFIRPLDMFAGVVDRGKYPDAGQKYRFELADIKSASRAK
jgi:hypothetical protein